MSKQFSFLLAVVLISFSKLIAGELKIIPAEKLVADAIIVRQAYENLHPGLYRYTDSLTMASHFDQLVNNANRDMTQTEAFLFFSNFLTNIKCGHTYTNYWNQSDEVKKNILGKDDKLPFTFELIDRQIVITRNLSDQEQLVPGTIITSIGGINSQVIIDSLLYYVKGDGGNLSQRLHGLQISGLEEYEAFDIFFPLIYPPMDQHYSITTENQTSDSKITTFVKTISRETRRQRMENRIGPIPKSYDDLWSFELLSDQVGYLKIGTFATYKMNMDWSVFIDSVFQILREKEISNLIFDIRGNGGGMTDVLLKLAQYLVNKPVEIDNPITYTRFAKVPDHLRPYLNTWDPSFYDLSDKVKAAGKGFYQSNEDTGQSFKMDPSPMAYQGQVYLLIDAANSSATFTLAQLVKEYELGTIIGQPTGGNQKGITGDILFFMNLPHSGIEMDIPLKTIWPYNDKPDAGIEPDHLVNPTIQDIINKQDTILNYTLSII